MQALSMNKNLGFLNKIDVRTKASISIIVSFLVVFTASYQALGFIFLLSFAYALSLKKFKTLFATYALFFLMMAISFIFIKVIVALYPGIDKQGLNLEKAIIPFLRGLAALNTLLPLALTIRMQDFLSCLQNLKLPLIIYLPCAVMVRFIVSFTLDIKQILEAIKLRGVKISFFNILKHPRLFLRLTYTPLIFLTIRTSDDLGIAAEIKGIGHNKPTYIPSSSLKKRDYQLLFAVLIFTSVTLILEQIYYVPTNGAIHP